MKTKIKHVFVALTLLDGWLAISGAQAAGLAATNTPATIPWNEIGAKAGPKNANGGEGGDSNPTFYP